MSARCPESSNRHGSRSPGRQGPSGCLLPRHRPRGQPLPQRGGTNRGGHTPHPSPSIRSTHVVLGSCSCVGLPTLLVPRLPGRLPGLWPLTTTSPPRLGRGLVRVRDHTRHGPCRAHWRSRGGVSDRASRRAGTRVQLPFAPPSQGIPWAPGVSSGHCSKPWLAAARPGGGTCVYRTRPARACRA